MSAFGRHFSYPDVPQQPRGPLRGALGGQGLIFSGFWGWQGGLWGVALAVIWLTFSIYAGLGLTCEGFLEGWFGLSVFVSYLLPTLVEKLWFQEVPDLHYIQSTSARFFVTSIPGSVLDHFSHNFWLHFEAIWEICGPLVPPWLHF